MPPGPVGRCRSDFLLDKSRIARGELSWSELLARGWTEADLAKLSRGNVLRALRGAEQAAARLQKSRAASHLTIEQLDRGQPLPNEY